MLAELPRRICPSAHIINSSSNVVPIRLLDGKLAPFEFIFSLTEPKLNIGFLTEALRIIRTWDYIMSWGSDILKARYSVFG
jgi:hypothetical protein